MLQSRWPPLPNPRTVRRSRSTARRNPGRGTRPARHGAVLKTGGDSEAADGDRRGGADSDDKRQTGWAGQHGEVLRQHARRCPAARVVKGRWDSLVRYRMNRRRADSRDELNGTAAMAAAEAMT